ncbi:MAG TPA: hypothetical protein G4O19_03135 [Dehalococcoidia bacterium]|nr:hypothetical protein [Dehalococcoidia bacterium]
MAEIPKDLKRMLFMGGARYYARMMMVMGLLTWTCLIVGIVSDATNRTLGLEPTSWFILAGISVLGAIWSWITSYFAAKEGYEK